MIKLIPFQYDIKGFTFKGNAEIDIDDEGDCLAYVNNLYINGLSNDVKEIIDYEIILWIEQRLQHDYI